MTLTEVNFYVKKFFPVFIIFGLVFLMLFFAVRLILLYSESSNPTPAPTAAPIATNAKFEKIKAPQIRETGPSANYTYVLDTLDGTTNIENATAAAQVFLLPKKVGSFGFLSQIYVMAKGVDIDTEVTKHVLHDRNAEFNDGKRRLIIDIDTYNFTYDYTIEKDDTLFKGSTPSATLAQDNARALLDKMDKYTEEISKGKRNTIFMRYDAGTKQIIPLQNEDGANMVEVDFYRPDIGLYPVVTSSYYNSPHYVLFATTERSGLVPVRAQVKLFDKSVDQIGLYPIRSGTQALDDLKKGKGMVVASDVPNGEVKIKKMFLAYYDPDEYQVYMQPVYVFLGEVGSSKFVAYVPAVVDEYLIR